MARKAKKVESKPEDENAVEPVKQAEKPADDKNAPENFDQYRARH